MDMGINRRHTQTDGGRQQKRQILLGAHFSIAGGLHKAILTASEYGCTALQIFTKNATTWKERTLSHQEVERFNEVRELTAIQSICSHTSYLINLASPEPSKYDRSLKALENELLRSSLLSIPYVIMHPGSHMGAGEDKGLQRIAQGINTIFDRSPNITCRLLLEATAGQGSSLGSWLVSPILWNARRGSAFVLIRATSLQQAMIFAGKRLIRRPCKVWTES
jgi:apurinic endonuclease APN1